MPRPNSEPQTLRWAPAIPTQSADGHLKPFNADVDPRPRNIRTDEHALLVGAAAAVRAATELFQIVRELALRLLELVYTVSICGRRMAGLIPRSLMNTERAACWQCRDDVS